MKAQRRFTDHRRADPAAMQSLAPEHPAVTGARTRYTATVVHPSLVRNALKSGHNSVKIGKRVDTGGKWDGLPIFTLTLEERATCPTSCALWFGCYGNRMHWAERLIHGADLEDRLERELGDLQQRHPGGFVVRLHVLGDFYSVAYVETWFRWLVIFPALHVWGYTAWPPTSEIGAALLRAWPHGWDRWCVRFSGGGMDELSASSLDHIPPSSKTSAGYVCPEQIGKAEMCATCGICWSTPRNIAFIQH